MAIIENNLPVFRQDIGNFSANYDHLASRFSDLQNHMLELNQMWEGEAHDALQNSFLADVNRVNDLLEYLGKYRDELRFADSEYTNCENKVASIIAQMDV